MIKRREGKVPAGLAWMDNFWSVNFNTVLPELCLDPGFGFGVIGEYPLDDPIKGMVSLAEGLSVAALK